MQTFTKSECSVACKTAPTHSCQRPHASILESVLFLYVGTSHQGSSALVKKTAHLDVSVKGHTLENPIVLWGRGLCFTKSDCELISRGESSKDGNS